jgi:hypothetical protein
MTPPASRTGNLGRPKSASEVTDIAAAITWSRHSAAQHYPSGEPVRTPLRFHPSPNFKLIGCPAMIPPSRQWGAAGQRRGYRCMERRPLFFRGVQIRIADKRLPENFSISLKAEANGELRRRFHGWRNPAHPQTRADLPHRIDQMLRLRALCRSTD